MLIEVLVGHAAQLVEDASDFYAIVGMRVGNEIAAGRLSDRLPRSEAGWAHHRGVRNKGDRDALEDRSHRDVVHRRIYRGNAVRGLRRTVVDR
jgi:hypothetical protein